MPDLLVRGVREEVKVELVARAARNGRSLQAEARRILEEAALQQEPGSAEAPARRSASLDSPEEKANRAANRREVFRLLDSINSQVNVDQLPRAAEMIAAAREEKDCDDARWLPGAWCAGGLS